MKSRLEGSFDDFVFMESPKVVLSLKKTERGTHIKLVTVHGKTKTFKRKQRVGRKEKDKVVKKEVWEKLNSDFIQQEDTEVKSGKITPTYTDFKEGDMRLDPLTQQIDILKPVKLNELHYRESIEGLSEREDVKQYIKWIKEGITPPPITIVEDFRGRKETLNRRRLFAMRVVGMKSTLAWQFYGNRRRIVKDAIKDGKKVPIKVQREIGFEKEIKKSSLHPDNLQGIDDLNESGIIGLVGGIHESETYICRFKDGSQAIHKTMQAGDIAGEIGAYETSKIIGWDVVPETIQCDYGKGEGSTQKWIPNNSEPYDGFDDNATLIEEKHLNDLSKIFILDMIAGNFDRHNGNLIIDENDHVWAIDNEMIGKRNNAELHIESLVGWSKKGEGSFVPMIIVLNNSFGDDISMYKNFKDHVDKNIDQVIQNKDEIIKYWSQYEDNKYLNTGIPIKEGINNIEKNIKYLENYRGK